MHFHVEQERQFDSAAQGRPPTTDSTNRGTQAKLEMTIMRRCSSSSVFPVR